MNWGKFAGQVGILTVVYLATSISYRYLNDPGQPLINYFRVIGLVSLGSLLVLGFDAVKEAEHEHLTLPQKLRYWNNSILLVALVAFEIHFLVLSGYSPTGPSCGANILRFMIAHSELLAMMPLFAFFCVNLIAISWLKLDGPLHQKVSQYFIYTDLPCAVPALALLLIVFGVKSVTSVEEGLVLAAGAALLIFVSNVATIAVNCSAAAIPTAPPSPKP